MKPVPILTVADKNCTDCSSDDCDDKKSTVCVAANFIGIWGHWYHRWSYRLLTAILTIRKHKIKVNYFNIQIQTFPVKVKGEQRSV